MEVPSLTFQFPPGFRFHPSDEELIIHYLQNKAISRPLPASIIAEIDLYKYNPWDLPNKALFGEDEWYFFSPRDRKYPKGARPNRAAGLGYWKAMGTDKPIFTCGGSESIGVKKALVFYVGRPPKGLKTDWMMHEYRLLDTVFKPFRLKGSMRLDDWVLCRIRQKGNAVKTTCGIQGRETIELMKYSPLPTIEQTPLNYVDDMITDCLSKNCQVLASLLAGQPLPSEEAISCVSFQGSNYGSISVFGYGENDQLNSPTAVSSMDCYYNPLNRKPDEELKIIDNELSYSSIYDFGLPPDVIIDLCEVDDMWFSGNCVENEHFAQASTW